MPDTHWKILEYLARLGFKTNPHNRLVETPEDALGYYRGWLDDFESLDYGCDGVVIKVDSFDLQRHMGAVGREPRWAVAYKFPATRALTRLLEITGQRGPYGQHQPLCRAGTRRRGRRDRQPGHPPQRGLREGEGPEGWRLGDRRARGRGDPADRQRRGGQAHGRRGALRHAYGVSKLRRRARST